MNIGTKLNFVPLIIYNKKEHACNKKELPKKKKKWKEKPNNIATPDWPPQNNLPDFADTMLVAFTIIGDRDRWLTFTIIGDRDQQSLVALSLRQIPTSLAFDTPNSKKSLPSRVVNAVIFGIDEQYNLKFETALFTNCKTYNIFLFSGARFIFFLFFSFSFPCLYSISHSCSKSHRY